jgi:UDP-N-acetylmuramate dehydrogenase
MAPGAAIGPPRAGSALESAHYPVLVPNPVLLSDLTTLRLGGPAPDLVTAVTADEVADAVGAADRAGSGVLVIGGGSNLVIADAGVDVPVVRIAVQGIRIHNNGDGSALVTVGAGEDWDTVVAELTEQGFAELSPLSGIPGSTGATPVQNVGAYGTEIAEMLTSVTVYDRASGEIRELSAADLRMGYRTSVLRGTNSAVIVDVTFRLSAHPVRIRYGELARRLGVTPGETAPPADVRDAVLELRRSKGMVLDPGDPDTCSAGSFFTNPILEPTTAGLVDKQIRAALGPDVRYPAYPVTGTDDVKLSAAWLIENAGFRKGHQGPGGRVQLSTKHTLALTNRGGSTADLLALAAEVRDGVRSAFGVTLHPEPVLVGVALPD